MKINLKPIRRKLKAQKIKQWELAERYGVSESTMSRYLHDRLPLPKDLLAWIEGTAADITAERAQGPREASA